MPKSRVRKQLPLAAALALTTASTASTGVSAAALLEMVVVTAQFREESLQDTPIAIKAYDAETIQNMGFFNARDIGLASPSLQMPAYPFSSNNMALFVRGIGNADSIVLTKDNTVGLYYDGVYAARSTGLLADLGDLERVEVLRGPQGTLYGRNTTAGAINLITKKPTGELGLDQTLSVGNYSAFRSATHVNLPDMGGLKAKVSAVFNNRDGWVENEGANQVPGYKYNDYYKDESDGYRLALRFDGIDNLLVDYSYDYSDMDSTPPYFQYGGPVGGLSVGFMPITDSFTDRLDNTRSPTSGEKTAYYLPGSNTEVEGHNLTITWDFNENLTFTSITGYREFDDDVSQNFSESFGDAGSLETHTVTDHEQFTQEFRLSGTYDKISFVGGAYYFDESGDQAESQFVDRSLVDEVGIWALGGDVVPDTPCGDGTDGLPSCFGFDVIFPAYLGTYTVKSDVESWAAFGQATYTINDRVEITAGLRYTDDDRESSRTNDGWIFNAFPPGATDSQDERVDYTLIADFNIADNASVYIKTGTGFRSGGSSRNGGDFNSSFGKEELVSYELGWKAEFADRFRVNGAVFYMENDDIILDYLPDPVNAPSLVETFNSGTAEITGLELDLQAAVLDNLVLGLGYTYLDYDIDDAVFPDGIDRSNTTELVWAPEHAVAVTADYTYPMDCGDLGFHLDYSWQDDQYALANTEFGEVIVGDYGLLNGRISMADIEMAGGTWQFAVWGKNLTDEDSHNYLIGATANTYLQPRTYGAEVNFRF